MSNGKMVNAGTPENPVRVSLEEETPEEWGMSYYFGMEMTQEQIEAQFQKPADEKEAKKGNRSE